MDAQKLLQMRRQRGYEIAQKGRVSQKEGVWLVPSQTIPTKAYKVVLKLEGSECTCEDFRARGIRCKHIFAVEITIGKSYDKNGNLTITQTKRITYSQNWNAYTKAQTEEVRLFDQLLKNLVENVDESTQAIGRPRTPLKEGLFCSIQKVYSQLSSRRAYSLYRNAEGKAQIAKAPNYNVINVLLNNPEITPILHTLLETTALPLKSVESQFAIDSTGFRTSKFGEYCNAKYGQGKNHVWLKAHLCVGVKTNVITAVEITKEYGSDSPQFIPLLNKTSRNGFDVQEVSADKAYNSVANYNAVREIGGVAFIPFKSNATGNSGFSKGSKGKLWRKMFLYFQMNQDEFMQHYHLRSNVESTNMAIKTKLGDCLKSKNTVSQTNELLCKLIAYNITVLISAIYELGIEPNITAFQNNHS